MEVRGVSLAVRLVDVPALPGQSVLVCKGFGTPHRVRY